MGRESGNGPSRRGCGASCAARRRPVTASARRWRLGQPRENWQRRGAVAIACGLADGAMGVRLAAACAGGLPAASWWHGWRGGFGLHSVARVLRRLRRRDGGPAVARRGRWWPCGGYCGLHGVACQGIDKRSGRLVVVATLVGSEIGAAAGRWVTGEILAWRYAEPATATPSAPCSR